MRRALPAVLLCACGGAHPAPASPEAPTPVEPVAEPFLRGCQMAPTVRADGLYELRNRPGELTGQPCAVGGADAWVEWAGEEGHMLVSPPGAPLGTDWIQRPIAVYDDGETVVAELRSGTSDRRCADEHVAAGTVVHIDRDDQRSAYWIPLEATDDPVRLSYLYTAGGCTARREGDATIIDLPDPTTGARPSLTAAVDAWDEDEVRFELVDDVLLVYVPWRSDVGYCYGTDPGPGFDPGPSTESPGFVAASITVPATASAVVVRTVDLGPQPECA